MMSAVCGIGALLGPASTFASDAPGAMVAALRHRGPDGEAVHRQGPALLVHTRLAIIDVAGGDQPLFSEDGRCAAVVNGEIYNHLALRRELEAEGHRFRTRSDCEVIVHAYEQWGADCVRRLNGMFAFALWDAVRRRLLVARDPYGVKPLYYWTDGRRVAAASEIGALLASGAVTPRVDRIALEHFLAWRFVPAPRTMLDGVCKLEAASLLVADEDGVRVSSYRERPGPVHDASESELAAELRTRFVDAVQRQMMSDVPYGAFLSGGIDSAAIAAAMSAVDERPPITFTIGFPGHGAAIDERDAAAATARALGTEHHATAMSQADFPDELAACVARLEEPCGIPSAPALLALSRFASQRVKVALSGQGADEPLGGYQRHQAAAILWLASRIPEPVGRGLGRVTRALPRNERLKRAGALLGSHERESLLGIFDISTPALRARLTGGAEAGDAARERGELAARVLAHVSDRDLLEQALYLDTHLFLPDGLLIYGDKMSMASGLEQRVPFLDVELMRFVERIPARLRVRGLRRKWLYRRAIAPLVPAEALRRRKQPFATPYDRWLRSELGIEVQRRYSPGSALSELLDPHVVDTLVSEHRSGRADHKRILYCLLELAQWHEHFIVRGSPSQPQPVGRSELGR